MAVQLSNKNEIGLLAALRNGSLHHKILATLALVALTTLSFAQNGMREHSTPPNRQLQPGGLPTGPPHPSATHSSVTPKTHGAAPVYGNATQPHTHPVGQAHLQPPKREAFSPHHTVPVSRTTGGTRNEHQLPSDHRVRETTQGGMLHAVRYGSGVTGVVERPIKSGYLSRTYVQGGHVLYARVYRQNTFQRFGHGFSYESLVPAVAFDTAYYTWAARPWATPVSYRWRWEAEPWHAAFGGSFTPYSNYSSLDEWLTDYVVAQNMRNAYDSWQAENAPESTPVVAKAPPVAGEGGPPAGDRPYWESSDPGQRPYWEETSDKAASSQPKSSKTHTSVSNSSASNSRRGSQNRPSAEDSPPPLPGDLKADLNAQIKQRLAERQTPTTTSDSETFPDSLKPGHTLFRVNTPLDVPSNAPGGYCSLKPNDYIERTGDMDENGMVRVKVRLGGVSDCGIGLTTNVSVNDLEAMENEQQQALRDALLAASKNMGGGGLPQAPATKPMLLVAGQTRPAPDATKTLSQLQ
jgi:hypothetical protein